MCTDNQPLKAENGLPGSQDSHEDAHSHLHPRENTHQRLRVASSLHHHTLGSSGAFMLRPHTLQAAPALCGPSE